LAAQYGWLLASWLLLQLMLSVRLLAHLPSACKSLVISARIMGAAAAWHGQHTSLIDLLRISCKLSANYLQTSCRTAGTSTGTQMLAAAKPEVQQMLLLHLASVVQQLQRKQQQQQQHDSNSPAAQLLAALGLSSAVDFSQFGQLNVDAQPVGMLAFAIKAHITGAISQQAQNASSKSCSSSSGVQDGGVLNSTQAGRQSMTLQCIVPPAVMKPLLLTLLQLCGQMAPCLPVMRLSMETMLALLKHHRSTGGPAAATAAGTAADAGAAADGVEMTEALQHASAEAAAAAASGAGMTAEATRHAFAEAADALVHPVLHVLGPAVLNAVRKDAQELAAVDRAFKAEPPGDDVVQVYGELLLHLLMTGERVLKLCCSEVVLKSLAECVTTERVYRAAFYEVCYISSLVVFCDDLLSAVT
jgi:hypothetical protein